MPRPVREARKSLRGQAETGPHSLKDTLWGPASVSLPPWPRRAGSLLQPGTRDRGKDDEPQVSAACVSVRKRKTDRPCESPRPSAPGRGPPALPRGSCCAPRARRTPREGGKRADTNFTSKRKKEALSTDDDYS